MTLKSIFFLSVVVVFGSMSTLAAGFTGTLSISENVTDTNADTTLITQMIRDADDILFTHTDSAISMFHTAALMLESVEDLKYRGRKCYVLGRLFHMSQVYDSGVLYTEYAVKFLKQVDAKKTLASALYNLGTIRTLLDMSFDQAAAELHQALELSKVLGDTQTVSRSYRMLGHTYSQAEKNEEALQILSEGIEVIKDFSKKENLASLYLARGAIYNGQEAYPKALESMLQGKAILEKIDNHDFDGEMFHNIGLIYESMEIADSALYYLRAGLNSHGSATALDQIPAYEMMGLVFEDIEQYDSAVYYMQQAIDLAKDHDIPCSAISSMINIGNLYSGIGEYDAAEKVLKEALVLYEDCGQVSSTPYLKLELGRLHYKRGNYNQGIKAFRVLLDEVLTMEDTEDLQVDLNSLLHRSYKKLGKYQLALTHLERGHRLSDSIYNRENNRKIALLEEKYKFDKEKERLVSQQEQEKLRIEADKEQAESNQRMAVIGSVLLLVIAFVILWAYLDRRKKSAQLAALNVELNQSNEKLKALDDYKTRLFANINHDFRTPLTLIKGYVDQIASNKDNYLSEKTEHQLENLRKNTTVLTQMTTEIQNLLLLEEGRLELSWSTVRLRSMLTLIINMFNSAAVQQQKKLDLKTGIDEEVIIHADKLYFQKMLFNLISNALRHTKSEDQITLSASLTDDLVKLEVTDTGEGIDESYLPHIFDRFYQSPGRPYARQEGFGIGLSLVKELVTLHNGDISVVSTKGEGSTFTIVLPSNLDQEVVAEERNLSERDIITEMPRSGEEASGAYYSGKKEKSILIVDDHEEIRSYIGSILSGEYNLHFAGNGKQALEMLTLKTVDLIITDLMMPWLDGFELIDQLNSQERLRNIPVLVVSARSANIDKQKVLEAGVNDFISKPFEADDLKIRVKNRIKDVDSRKSNAWQAIASDKDLINNVEKSILSKIDRHVIDRIDDPNLTVEDIASEINASRSKAFRLIKELTNQTPKAYIKSIRLQYVHELISQGKIKNASEGARAIGMLNGTEFKKQYEAKYGPLQFDQR